MSDVEVERTADLYAIQHRTADPLERRVLDAALAGDAGALEEATDQLRAVRKSAEHDRRFSSPEYLRFTEVVAGSRQTGKTYKLAEWVREGRREAVGGVVNSRRLVVGTVDQGRHLVTAGLLEPTEIVSVRQAQTLGAGKLTEYAVDEGAEVLARALSQTRVPAVVSICTPYVPSD